MATAAEARTRNAVTRPRRSRSSSIREPSAPVSTAANSETLYNQGVVLWNSGKFAEAKAQFEAADRDPSVIDDGALTGDDDARDDRATRGLAHHGVRDAPGFLAHRPAAPR